MESFNDFFVQLGAIGLLLFGLIWFSQYLFKYMMESLKTKTEENKELDEELRSYLLTHAKEHHELIRQNTEVFAVLINLIEVKLEHYFEEKNERAEQLIKEIKNLGTEIKKCK